MPIYYVWHFALHDFLTSAQAAIEPRSLAIALLVTVCWQAGAA